VQFFAEQQHIFNFAREYPALLNQVFSHVFVGCTFNSVNPQFFLAPFAEAFR